MSQFCKKILSWSTLLGLSVLLSGCATHGPHNPADPYEGYNRAAFKVNDALDKVIFKPVAVVYDKVVPAPASTGVSNFFNNLATLPKILNDLLQLRPRRAWRDVWRFGLNSTVGVGGLIDVADRAGLPDLPQDFGLTLARWGYQNSAYFVYPIFGPSTVRDAFGQTAGFFLSAWPYIQPECLRNQLFALSMIDARAGLLDAEKIMHAAAIDPYVFVRDAYLQRRQAQVAYIRGETGDPNAGGAGVPTEANTQTRNRLTPVVGAGADFVPPAALPSDAAHAAHAAKPPSSAKASQAKKPVQAHATLQAQATSSANSM